ncbi:MAG: hypothetical protein KC713_06420 [Candidatus Omnitrophica bacterium]|nr:hypothetical protein [Candidatus Omnitrophota bacterium]
MNKSFNQFGLTLTELLLSTILVGFVMAGIAVFSVNIKNIHDTSNKSVLVAGWASSALTHIRRNGILAIGDHNDQGVQTDATYISFRQDRNQTPSNYDDDIWLIYNWDKDDAVRALWVCEQTSIAAGGDGPVPDLSSTCDLDNSPLTLIYQHLKNFVATVKIDETDRQMQILLSLTTIYNPLLPVDPIDNPEITLNTTIHPYSHSK